MTGKTSKESEIHDNRELNRRNAANKTKIMFKIVFNGKEVCQSQSKIIGQDFVVPIGQIFPIQIQQWPESLNIQIIEGSTLKSSVIADVNIPICDPNTSLDKVIFFLLRPSPKGKGINAFDCVFKSVFLSAEK